ncbi:hypothetical protein GCM10025859_68090 [Alicyclobacillus fastidiosus]|nr:hypothetical protein GCM10025859_68090 [Alicyclobacillus fastidiosus]
MDPNVTNHIKETCIFGLTLCQVNIHNPKNVDSRKKASRASTAKGAPKYHQQNVNKRTNSYRIEILG